MNTQSFEAEGRPELASKIMRLFHWVIAIGVLASIALLLVVSITEPRDSPVTAADLQSALKNYPQPSFRLCLELDTSSAGLVQYSTLHKCELGSLPPAESEQPVRREQQAIILGAARSAGRA